MQREREKALWRGGLPAPLDAACRQSLLCPEGARGQDGTGNAAGDPACAGAAVPAARGAAAAVLPCPAIALPGRAEPALATVQAAPLAAGECKRHCRQHPRGGSLEAGGGTPTPPRSPWPCWCHAPHRCSLPWTRSSPRSAACWGPWPWDRPGQWGTRGGTAGAAQPARLCGGSSHPSTSAGERGEPEPPAPGQGPVALGQEAPVAFCFSHGPPLSFPAWTRGQQGHNPDWRHDQLPSCHQPSARGTGPLRAGGATRGQC